MMGGGGGGVGGKPSCTSQHTEKRGRISEGGFPGLEAIYRGRLWASEAKGGKREVHRLLVVSESGEKEGAAQKGWFASCPNAGGGRVESIV